MLSPTIAALLFFVLFRIMVCAQSVALPSAFAHNDYRHKRPLYDALTNGFTNMEADIFLHNGNLLVLHRFPFFKGKRTLESLYLDPLLEYVNSRQYTAQSTMDTLVLMIDIKTRGEKTARVLMERLEKYKSILSSWEGGKLVRRNVTIVLSGHRPLELLRQEENRFVFVDERLPQVNKDEAGNDMYAMASCKYSKLLSWKGKGNMPEKERCLLRDLVAKAHQYGKKVRLWASPEKEKVWTALLDCGVDLINTDRLEAYRMYTHQNHKQMITAVDYDLWVE